MDKITIAIIIVASLILTCQVFYYGGYISALKDVSKMLNDNSKVGTEAPCSEDDWVTRNKG